MDLKELKRKLSKILGVNVFDNKYSQSELDKVLQSLSGDNASNNNQGEQETDTKDNETPTIGDGVVGESEAKKDTEALEPFNEEHSDEKDDAIDTHDTNSSAQKAEFEAEEQRLKEVIGEDVEQEVEAEKEQEVDTTDTPNQPEPTSNANDYNEELLNTKLELELVRAGVREDRLEVAKELFMPKFKANLSVDNLRELIAKYPEWLSSSQGKPKGFGMPLGEKTDVLTAEEKRLKQMGIDPKG